MYVRKKRHLSRPLEHYKISKLCSLVSSITLLRLRVSYPELHGETIDYSTLTLASESSD